MERMFYLLYHIRQVNLDKQERNLDKNRRLKVKFAFQLRIKPESYNIGQETIGATRKGKIVDENFSNNELEWYTKQNMSIVLYGLLLNVSE